MNASFTTAGDYTSATYYHKADYADDELVNGIDVSYWQADAALKKKYYKDRTKWTQAGLDWESIHGAGIDIARPCGNMIVDIGGGTSDIAVISLGGTVVSASIKIAGDDFDEAIVRYMRKKHNLLIGERTAEDIKIKIGTCYPLPQPETIEVRGRNLVTGLPRTITVSSEETEEALREATLQIVEAVHSVLEKTPPELAADVADRGIVLTGGGSLLRGLE